MQLLQPVTPRLSLRVRTMPALPLPKEWHFDWKFHHGRGGRAGVLKFLCLLRQEVAESLGSRKTSSRSSRKPVPCSPPGLGTGLFPQVGLSW